jgi:hypothetical protein
MVSAKGRWHADPRLGPRGKQRLEPMREPRAADDGEAAPDRVMGVGKHRPRHHGLRGHGAIRPEQRRLSTHRNADHRDRRARLFALQPGEGRVDIAPRCPRRPAGSP